MRSHDSGSDLWNVRSASCQHQCSTAFDPVHTFSIDVQSTSNRERVELVPVHDSNLANYWRTVLISQRLGSRTVVTWRLLVHFQKRIVEPLWHPIPKLRRIPSVVTFCSSATRYLADQLELRMAEWGVRQGITS
jgi:hypothetical protein